MRKRAHRSNIQPTSKVVFTAVMFYPAACGLYSNLVMKSDLVFVKSERNKLVVKL